ncbi:MAG: hypothetical protein H6703_16915 [Myxococcales bacterium]|nr:hypothetical protein [Myxococcales bacterium]
MHYLLLSHDDEPPGDEATARAVQARFVRRLMDGGHLRAADRLHPAASARTVRRSGGEATAGEGSFATAAVMSYALVTVDDEAAAVELARAMPAERVTARRVASAHLLPRDGKRPAGQCAMLCYGVAPPVVPVHSALRAWIRLDPGEPGPALRWGARIDGLAVALPHALAVVDGGIEVAEALARVVVPEGGAIELRRVVG